MESEQGESGSCINQLGGPSVTEERKEYRDSGRHFSDDELEAIRTRIETTPKLNRWAFSIWVCEQFGWRKPDGGLKDMSCRVALLRMEKMAC